MRKLILSASLFLSLTATAQSIDNYFESIRGNTANLTAFFSAMPKGGDLHNHFSGSVYAETYITYVVQKDYFVDTTNVKVDTYKVNSNCLKFSQLDKMKMLPAIKQRLIQKWSVKDYNGVSYPSDLQFFETFAGFGIANNSMKSYENGLLELKKRAQKENVSYIETMFTSIPCDNLAGIDTGFNGRLLDAQRRNDEAYAAQILEQMYQWVRQHNGGACAATFNNDVVTSLHNRLHIDDSTFTMRYQNYVTRVIPPADVFKNLVVAFESANTCPLIVGVNIVAPENNEISMRDYWLHMQMFKFCHGKYPNVKYAMHAGELTLGMVKPEELTWHINAAVRTAGANRIGHGVDMPYEAGCYDLLRQMAKTGIAIEINLYSNEFILKVKEDQHPFGMYKEFGVPVVICTDDAGVLRSNLTDQYVLLAKRYRNVTYQDIKKYVYNSIEYSFIKDQMTRERLKKQLNTRFDKFEKEMMAAHQ